MGTDPAGAAGRAGVRARRGTRGGVRGGRSFADVFGFALADLYDGTAFYPDPMACLDALEAQVRAAIAARRGGR